MVDPLNDIQALAKKSILVTFDACQRLGQVVHLKTNASHAYFIDFKHYFAEKLCLRMKELLLNQNKYGINSVPTLMQLQKKSPNSPSKTLVTVLYLENLVFILVEVRPCLRIAKQLMKIKGK